MSQLVVLGIDPGLKETGCCVFLGDRSLTWTIVHEGGLARAVADLGLLIVASAADVIGLEDFTHRGYLGRRISNEADMAKLVGFLQGLDERVKFYDAGDTKANMGPLEGQFRNSHEFSAYCVANYAHGIAIRDMRIAQSEKGAR